MTLILRKDKPYAMSPTSLVQVLGGHLVGNTMATQNQIALLSE